jgi:hypothetical protein
VDAEHQGEKGPKNCNQNEQFPFGGCVAWGRKVLCLARFDKNNSGFISCHRLMDDFQHNPDWLLSKP